MERYIEVLKRCRLFSGLEKPEITSLLGCLSARVFSAEKRNAVFMEGDPAAEMGVVLSGAVQVVRDDYYGNRNILATVEPGQMFGETFACVGAETMPVSVLAVEDSRVLLLNVRRVLTTCSQSCSFHSRLIRNLLQVVAEKNLQLNRKLDLLTRRTTREKLMAYLLGEAKRWGSSEFTIPYDRQGLADFLGVERSAMAAELSKLRREGVLESRKNRFRLVRPLAV